MVRSLCLAAVMLELHVVLAISLPTMELTKMARSYAPFDEVEGLAQAYNHFGLKMYNHLKNRKENILFSPLTAASVASMLQMGTHVEHVQGVDQTFIYPDIDEELQKAYSQLRDVARSASLELYNGVVRGQYLPHPVLDSYINALKSVYNAYSNWQANFIDDTDASKNRILKWIGSSHDGYAIKRLLEDPMLNRLTSLVLMSSSKYDKQWNEALHFEETNTKVEEFRNYNGTLSMVEMMYTLNRNLNYTYSKSLGSQIVELPFEDRGADMYIFLPKEGVHGLDDLEDKLTVKEIEGALKDMKPDAVEIKLPKLNTPSTYKEWHKRTQETNHVPGNSQLDTALNAQGITGNGDLALTGIGHGGYLRISEKNLRIDGISILAAETTDEVPGVSGHGLKQVFCTRPFLYLIREKRNGLIMQMGSLRNIN